MTVENCYQRRSRAERGEHLNLFPDALLSLPPVHFVSRAAEECVALVYYILSTSFDFSPKDALRVLIRVAIVSDDLADC